MFSGAIATIEELRTDAKIGKNKHFTAADRSLRRHYQLGVPSILINVLIGTVILSLLTAMPTAKWLGIAAAILSFAAASVTSLQTLFNFNRLSEGHRSIANRYLQISRECKILLGEVLDRNLEVDELWERVKGLQERYNQINTEAESFPTIESDLEVARKALEVTPYKHPQIGLASTGVSTAIPLSETLDE